MDCAAVVGGCTYRYYILLRAGDMYALILDQEEAGSCNGTTDSGELNIG